jgi:hypothetical protein
MSEIWMCCGPEARDSAEQEQMHRQASKQASKQVDNRSSQHKHADNDRGITAQRCKEGAEVREIERDRDRGSVMETQITTDGTTRVSKMPDIGQNRRHGH